MVHIYIQDYGGTIYDLTNNMWDCIKLYCIFYISCYINILK